MYYSSIFQKALKFGYTLAKKKNIKSSIALIKKSNDLIEARYKFDVWETRFFLTVLSKIHKDDDEFETYRVHYKEIIKTFGLKATSSYEHLRNAAKSLMDKKVTVDYEENGHKREKIYHLIRHIDLLKEGRVGAADLEQQEYVDVVVESQMRPLLLHLQKNFTAYDLRNVINLGVYPVRIYELLKQYEVIGHRLLYIEDMKKMFNLSEEYPKFSNFSQKVIEPAITEINKHTDLKILKVEKIKEGRKVVGIEFFFMRKTEDEIRIIRKELPREKSKKLTLFEYIDEAEVKEFAEAIELTEELLPAQSEQDRLFMQYQRVVVGDFGVSPTVFIAELPNYQEIQIQQAIRVTERAIKDGKAKNSAAFFIEALRKGFTDPQEVKAQKKAANLEIEIHNAQIESRIEEMEDIKVKALSDKIRALTTMNPEITTQIIAAIKANKKYQAMIAAKEKSLERALDIEDFREDKDLRFIAKNEIMNTYQSEFTPIAVGYDAQIETLRKQKR